MAHLSHLALLSTAETIDDCRYNVAEFLAICCRPSVCHLSVCLSVVGNARAPYSADCNFPQCFYGIWYVGHPLTSMKNFTEIVPAEPLRRDS